MQKCVYIKVYMKHLFPNNLSIETLNVQCPHTLMVRTILPTHMEDISTQKK